MKIQGIQEEDLSPPSQIQCPLQCAEIRPKRGQIPAILSITVQSGRKNRPVDLVAFPHRLKLNGPGTVEFTIPAALAWWLRLVPFVRNHETLRAEMDSPNVDLMRRAMQAYAWRNQALSANIANLDTPDARRLTVSFEEELQRALQSRDATRAHKVEPRLVQGTTSPILEDELTEPADTQMRTQFVARDLREHYDRMRMRISGHTR